MNKIIAEVSLVPMGTGTSLSAYVAEALKVLKNKGLKYTLTPMSTIIEGTWDEVLSVVKEMQEAIFHTGVHRIVTNIKIDDRRDLENSMERKIKSVEEKLSKNM